MADILLDRFEFINDNIDKIDIYSDKPMIEVDKFNKICNEFTKLINDCEEFKNNSDIYENIIYTKDELLNIEFRLKCIMHKILEKNNLC